MISAGIVGVSGYGGGELARLLAHHPHAQLSYVVSETYAGQPLRRAFAGLAGTPTGDLICQRFDIGGKGVSGCDVLFLAQENGQAMRTASHLLDRNKRVVDLSADFRLRDIDVYEQTYKIEHQAAMLIDEGVAVYGLPELNREYVEGARLVANPGCYPTATILALAPLLSSGLVETRGIVIDAKSGLSGAGRSKSDLPYRYAEANESFAAYGVGGGHRHVPEIEQELRAATTVERVRVAFTPHLVPMTRGLLATCYAPLAKSGTTSEQVLAAYRAVYANAPFVVVRDDPPATKDVYGSNFCHLSARVDHHAGMVVAVSVIDNLIKGAAGQAIQNMNLMLGLPETAGLEATGLWP